MFAEALTKHMPLIRADMYARNKDKDVINDQLSCKQLSTNVVLYGVK